MRHDKQHLFLASLLLTLLLIQVSAVQAAPETVVSVEPYSSNANTGETFTINITVADVQNLYGIEATLHWNESILQVVNVDLRLGVESYPDGVLHESLYIAENDTIQEQGIYSLGATSLAPAPSFNGTGNIVRITFTVISPGDCNLDLQTELWDRPPPNQVSMPIEHTTIGGIFSVIPEFPNILIWPLFIILTIFVVVLRKKISRKPGSKQSDPLAFQTRFISVRKKFTRYAGWLK